MAVVALYMMLLIWQEECERIGEGQTESSAEKRNEGLTDAPCFWALPDCWSE